LIARKVTLVAATATKIVTGGVGARSVMLKTALTDLCLGESAALTATGGYAFAAAITNVTVPTGNDDLWAFSTTGGDIFVLYPENA